MLCLLGLCSCVIMAVVALAARTVHSARRCSCSRLRQGSGRGAGGAGGSRAAGDARHLGGGPGIALRRAGSKLLLQGGGRGSSMSWC